MSSSTRPSTLVGSWSGRLVGAGVALAIVFTSVLLGIPPAAADSAVTVRGGSVTIKGAGFGHGLGMSQYGAYGAARKGLTWQKILAYYYPGTKLATLPSATTIRVWVTADNDKSLRVRPAKGLAVADTSGHRFTVPTGAKYKSWRIIRAGSGYRLSYLTSSGAHVTTKTNLAGGTWSFSTPAKVVKLVLPGGSTRAYRGSLALVKRGSGGRTVNKVRLEDYVRGVLQLEIPTSWAANAVRAQAVATRSFAVRLRDATNYPGYDLCDNSNCQNYRGMASETAKGDAAVKATASRIVTYHGAAALTQFAPSNGGHTAKGGMPYLTAHADKYDGLITSQSWTRHISARSIAHAWPSVGTVKQLKITSRDGAGAWGGRVGRIKIIGSKKTVSVSGGTFQNRFGMRSRLYHVVK